MQCLYCGKRIWAGWGNRSAEFCSDDHRLRYDKERKSPQRLENVPTVDLQPADMVPIADPILGLVKTERELTMPGTWCLSATVNRGVTAIVQFKRPSPHAAGELYGPGWLDAFGVTERWRTPAVRNVGVELHGRWRTVVNPTWLGRGLRLVRPAYDRGFAVRVRAVRPTRGMFSPEGDFHPGAIETLTGSPVLRLEREKEMRQSCHSIASEPTSRARWLSPLVRIAWRVGGAAQHPHGLPRAEDRLLPAPATQRNVPAIRVGAPQPLPASIRRCEPVCPTNRKSGCRSTGPLDARAEPAAPPKAAIRSYAQSRRFTFSPAPPAFFGGKSVRLEPSQTQVPIGSDPWGLPMSSAFPMAPSVAGESFADPEKRTVVGLCLPFMSGANTAITGFLHAAAGQAIPIVPDAGNADEQPVAFGTLKAWKPAIPGSTLPASVPKRGLAVLALFLVAVTEAIDVVREAAWREPRELPMDATFAAPVHPSVDRVWRVRRDWARGEISWAVSPVDHPSDAYSARGAIAKSSPPAHGDFWPDAMAAHPHSPKLGLEQEIVSRPGHHSLVSEPVFRARWAYEPPPLALPPVSRLEQIRGLPERDSPTPARPEPVIPGTPAVRIEAQEPVATAIIRREPRRFVQPGPEISPGDCAIDCPTPAAPCAPFVEEDTRWVDARIAAVPKAAAFQLAPDAAALRAGRETACPLAEVSPPMDTKAGPEEQHGALGLCFYAASAGTQAVMSSSLRGANERRQDIFPDPPDCTRHDFAFEAAILLVPVVEFRRPAKSISRPAPLLSHTPLDDRANASELHPFASTDIFRTQPTAIRIPTIVDTGFCERGPTAMGIDGTPDAPSFPGFASHPSASPLPAFALIGWEHGPFAVLATRPSVPPAAAGKALPSLHQIDPRWALAGPALPSGAKVAPHRLAQCGDSRRSAGHYAVSLHERPVAFRSAWIGYASQQVHVVQPLAGWATLGQPRASVADSELLDSVGNLRDLRHFSFSTKKLPSGSFGCTPPAWRYESDHVPLDFRWQRKRSIWNRGARWKAPVNLSSLPSMNLPLLPA